MSSATTWGPLCGAPVSWNMWDMPKYATDPKAPNRKEVSAEAKKPLNRSLEPARIGRQRRITIAARGGNLAIELSSMLFPAYL